MVADSHSATLNTLNRNLVGVPFLLLVSVFLLEMPADEHFDGDKYSDANPKVKECHRSLVFCWV